jgi:hypothetical protein
VSLRQGDDALFQRLGYVVLAQEDGAQDGTLRSADVDL